MGFGFGYQVRCIEAHWRLLGTAMRLTAEMKILGVRFAGG